MSDRSAGGRWTREQLKLAFYLYCRLPFGKLHQHNPEIVALANFIGRTPSAVAMKLSNFASLDPSITSTGRRGLEGASQLDREVWDEFHADWERLAIEAATLSTTLEAGCEAVAEADETGTADFSGETRQVLVEQRVRQRFFREMVLSSYRARCCMCGVSETRLLVASHIVPWSVDKSNRLNPRNGLCLSSIHDRAFDQGLISLTDDLRVLVSSTLSESQNGFTRETFAPLHRKMIEVPERFLPDTSFIAWHRNTRFVDAR